MTIGKDVSTLFTDVINCIQTGKSFISYLLCSEKLHYSLSYVSIIQTIWS